MDIKTSFDNTKNAIANIWNNMPKNAGLIGHLLECRYPYTLFAMLNNVMSHDTTKTVSMEIPT